MTVESAAFISGLNSAYPPGSDSISEGDDHLRLLKTVLQGTFPNANVAINGIHTGTSAPTVKTAGTIWYDTTASNKVLKIYNGTGWITLVSSPETDFKLLGATNVGWILPTADGVAGQYLKTDASGNLDWATIVSPSSLVLKAVTHKTDSSSNRPEDDDTYENTGMFVTHTKASATSDLYIQFDCYVNVAVDFDPPASAQVTGYLGDSPTAAGLPASTIIGGTSAHTQILIEDPIGTSGTWDWTNTFSRMFKVTAANCPDGTTGANTFTWVNKISDRSEMVQVLSASWMVWEIES